MTSITIGDLAYTFLIKRQTSGLKSEMARLASELTTGQKADLGASLAGDFGPFAGIERSLRAIAAYTTANSEAAGMLTALRRAVGARPVRHPVRPPASGLTCRARRSGARRTS